MPINFPSNPTLNQIFSTNTKSWIYGTNGWKAYDVIGTVANNSVTQVTATGGQTSFTVPDYVQGQNQIRVFINGVRQNNIVDFTETTSSSITLTSPATAGDNVAFEVITYAGTPLQIGLPTIIDDTTTNATRFPLFVQSTGGGLNIVNTDSTGFTFNPSTGALTIASIVFGDATTQATAANTIPVNTFAQAAFNSANAGVTLATSAYAQANAAATPTSINTRGLQASASYFLTFVDANNSTNAAETIHTHGNLNYNPSSGSLSANSLGIGTSASGTNGEIRATGDVVAFFSDERLKDILGTIPDPINKVMQISGVFFKNNDVANEYGYTKKHTQVGVIAQEIQKVLPDAIDLAPFDTEYDADENKYSRSGKYYLTVRHEKIIPLLIEAIKEQQKNIDILLENQKELSQEIERLKKEI
jgi:hypothetical protein